MIDNSILDELTFLNMQDFKEEAHRTIWYVMKQKYENNEPIDYLSMKDSLERLIPDIMPYLMQMANSVPSVHAAPRYAKKIKQLAIRRQAKELADAISQLADEAETTEELIDQIEKKALTLRPDTNDNMKHVSELRQGFFEYLGEQEDYIFTGFQAFDKWMGGLGRGWLYILAGRPSAGKTAKALQMGYGIAKSGAGEVLIWSQEMTWKQVLARMLSTISQVNGNRIRKKELTDDEVKKLSAAYDHLQKLPLHVSDASGVTIEEVRATARQVKRKKGKIGAIIIDYLGIMKIVQRSGETRAQAIGHITRTAKQMAKELECPVILLAQMNREGAKQEEPDLSNLKESGDIEQDADIVEFVYEADEQSPNGKVVIGKIAKGRDVGVNKFKYLFKGWIQKYEEME